MPTDVIMCTWVGFRPIYWKCWTNNVVSTVLRWFDLAMTLRWPYHDLRINPLWNPTPTHVTMCTWLGFRPIYFYTTLKVKGTLLPWPLVTLSMHRKSADHLKVTWYIIRLKKIWSTKVPRGRGGTDGPKVHEGRSRSSVGNSSQLARISTFCFWSVSGDKHIASGMGILKNHSASKRSCLGRSSVGQQ